MTRLCTALLVLVLSLTGCFDLEQEIALERDLSGTSTMDITIDLDRMAWASAYVQRMFMGQQGEPTAAEVEAARAELVAAMEDDEFDLEEQREEFEAELPEGVRLLDVRQDQDGSRIRTHLAFAFDHISRLQEVDLAAGREDEMAMAGPDHTQPFGSLVVVDEGGTVLITSDPPTPDAEDDMGMPGGEEMMEAMAARMLEGVKATYRIRTPLQVVEHNATSTDGNTLVWEYDLAALSAPGAPAAEGIRLRLRK